MSWNRYSRSGLVLCIAGGLTLSGCAGSGWNRLVGKKDQPSAKLTLAWAKLKEEEGKLTDARTGYEKVLAQQPNNVDAVLGMSRMNVKAQRMVDAEQGYDRALKLSPKSPAVLSEVGQFYAQQQRWDKAIPLLQEAQRIEPHEKNHQFTLAVALTKAGRTTEALPHFTDAVGEAAAHYNVGRLLVESGKTTEAQEQFTLALTKDPGLSDAQFFLDEIRAGGNSSAGAAPIVAQPKKQPVATQQVSGTSASDRQTVTPAESRVPSGRSPLYPHVGYEELPPPSASTDEASLSDPKSVTAPSSILQASGYTPAAPPSPRPVPKLRLLPAATADGAHMRLSTTQQAPLGR